MAEHQDDMEVIEHADGTIQVIDPADGTDLDDQQQPAHADDTQAAGQGHDDDDGDDDDGQDATGAGDTDQDTDDTQASRTEQNRQRRQEKKQRIRERNERLRNELAARDALINEMSGRLAVLERRSTGSEMAHVENELRKVSDAYGYYKAQIADAHGKPEAGPIVADAAEKMALARQRYDELNRLRQQMLQAQNRPSPIDPRVLTHAQEWASRNSWYDPAGRDEASRVTLAIDEALAQEGWHPGTPEYWKELDRRVKSRLPEKYNSGNNRGSSGNPPPRSVVTGSGRESGRPGPTKGYTLSPDRVKALKEAGMWDDPAVRNDMIRRYRQQDLQNQR